MNNQLKPALSDEDHSQGSNNAAVTLVEYGDYQCGDCGDAYVQIKDAQDALGDDLRVVFRNFPLAESHPHATAAAQAAEAAARQNKFWEMHDVLLENQQALSSHDLMDYAKQVGLDLEQFKQDLKSGAVSDKVDADFESGARSGVNGTPSFFINGEKYDGDWRDGALTDFLQRQL